MKLSNKIILGLGTGRCGTVNLSDFLKQQTEMALCTHEHLKWKWYKTEPISIEAFNRYATFQNAIVGEVGSFLLPHVHEISNFFKETKIIVVKRNKEDTIKSWMKWTNKFHNYWVPHTKGYWQNDPWDPMFPKFDMEDKPKEVTIGKYYDYYYEECEKLKSSFDTLWIRTENLEKTDTRKLICDFCGINNCNLNVICRKNSSNPTIRRRENEIGNSNKKDIVRNKVQQRLKRKNDRTKTTYKQKRI